MLDLSGKTILVVDDDEEYRRLLVSHLGVYKAKVFQASCGINGLQILENRSVDLVVTDIHMRNGDGLTLLKGISEKNSKSTGVFVITGYSAISVEDLQSLGAHKVFKKPFPMGSFNKALRQWFNEGDAEIVSRGNVK